MKLISLLYVVILFFPFTLFAQTNKYLENLNEKNIKCIEIKEGILELTYSDNTVTCKNINSYNKTSENIVPVTSIDLTTIDTAFYSSLYKFYKKVPISQGPFYFVFFDDFNINGKIELYGLNRIASWIYPIIILETDSLLNHSLLHSFDDTTNGVHGIYDIDNDGRKELFLRTWGNNLLVYNKDSSLLPINCDFIFSNYNFTQIEDLKFGDFDKNGIKDILFCLLPNTMKMVIAEYDSSINNFSEVYNFFYDDFIATGFAVGDFDDDSLTEFVMGSINGEVYVNENKGIHSYKHTWSGSVPTHNAYLFFETNDIDKNGKKEFWVGGDAFYNGVPKTVFTCFENNGDDDYTAVHQIDFIGVFSFNAGNCFAKDFDKDGVEELFICIDQNVIILKFTGYEGSHDYEIYYLKRNENPHGAYYGATSYDINKDEKEEIFISQEEVINNNVKIYTDVYKEKTPVYVEDTEEIFSAQPFFFPNPFNSTINIQFPSAFKNCTIKLFNVIGQQIDTILTGVDITSGEIISWQPGGLSSGIYFLKVFTGDNLFIHKLIYLK